MRKETIVKEDGRLLTYYWFDHGGAGEDTASDADCESLVTGRSSSEPSESSA